MESTWNSRDLPVLDAIVSINDATRRDVNSSELEQATGLDEDDIQRALTALGDTYLRRVLRVTDEARRAVGMWPKQELVGAIDRLIAETQDPTQKSKLQRFRDAVLELGTKLASEVIVKLVTTPLG
ncbi:MAG: hypothetical protein DLM55_03340 [Acidimicrobiales bacterium]|nr:MAG: hypothetical protein DLM55_03340 [Acidimicrobiales bacterium]